MVKRVKSRAFRSTTASTKTTETERAADPNADRASEFMELQKELASARQLLSKHKKKHERKMMRIAGAMKDHVRCQACAAYGASWHAKASLAEVLEAMAMKFVNDKRQSEETVRSSNVDPKWLSDRVWDAQMAAAARSLQAKEAQATQNEVDPAGGGGEKTKLTVKKAPKRKKLRRERSLVAQLPAQVHASPAEVEDLRDEVARAQAEVQTAKAGCQEELAAAEAKWASLREATPRREECTHCELFYEELLRMHEKVNTWHKLLGIVLHDPVNNALMEVAEEAQAEVQNVAGVDAEDGAGTKETSERVTAEKSEGGGAKARRQRKLKRKSLSSEGLPARPRSVASPVRALAAARTA